MSSSQDKKRSAGKPGALPVGENKTGLTPAIPFCEPKVDEDDYDIEMVDIRVMIDPLKGLNNQTNIDIKTFPSVKNLMGTGLEVLKLRRSLNRSRRIPIRREKTHLLRAVPERFRQVTME